ncbi:hypothetical protein [Agaribacterium sp. ZY112]|uniref:hypothetical protein n=1 Tax=Agaribacterium sp. ZY112 TaxID=3233574 RepID=UPI003523E769
MRYVSVRRLGLMFAGICIGALSSLSIAEQCAQIDCDCSSLPSAAFEAACKLNESRLKKSCSDDSVGLVGWCTVHGLDAKPVAVSTKRKPYYSPSQSIKTDNKQIEAELWSLRHDADFVVSEAQKGNASKAINILKISQKNARSLFDKQNSVIQVWQDKQKQRRIVSAWDDYAEGNSELAAYWSDKLLGLEAETAKTTELSEFGAEQKMLVRLYLYVGQLYEYTAFSYEGQKDWESAAKAWSLSARNSAQLTQVLIGLGAEGKALVRYQDLTAARLYRASVLASMADKPEMSYQAASEAQAFKPDQLLMDILNADLPS